MAPLDAVRAYLRRRRWPWAASPPPMLARPGGHARRPATATSAHNDYLVAVTRSLLDLAVERGDIADVDTAAVARVMANLGQRPRPRPR